jgi:hypothetical protein
MDTRFRSNVLSVAIGVAVLLGLVGVAVAQGPGPQDQTKAKLDGAAGPQLAQTLVGTAFTYQGQLKNASGPVNGACDFRFSLWDSLSNLTGQMGTTQDKPGVSVSNGMFAVPLDFGNVFTGEARWLEIAVKCSGDAGYSALTPRQVLTPAPYALALPGLRTQQNANSPNLIGGHISNTISAGAYGATIGGGGSSTEPNLITGTFGTIGGGAGNTASGEKGTVAGGHGNTASGMDAAVGGGHGNTASDYAAVGGGWSNTASGHGAFIGGGGYDGSNALGNQAAGAASTIGGGLNNIITSTGSYAFIGGGGYNTASQNVATVGGGWHNTAGGAATVGGGWYNTANGNAATVGGGSINVASGSYATVGGGAFNTASGISATVSGGYNNNASGSAATVGGGANNIVTAAGKYAFIGGGWNNTVSGQTSAIGGGYNNIVTSTDATIAGGWGNYASGDRAMIPGGALNTAAGSYSFAAGLRAKAYNKGCFAWNDSTNADLVCNDDNVFVARATGAVIFYTNAGNTAGVWVPPGGNGWSSVSDRSAKDNFAAVDGRVVLARLAQIPITTWNYKSQDASIRHIGPMAQDFATFGVGEDDTHISTIDADGVALAAIQGLNQLVQEKDARLNQLETQNTALEDRVAALEARMNDGNASSSVPVSWLLAGGLLALGAVVVERRRRGGVR